MIRHGMKKGTLKNDDSSDLRAFEEILEMEDSLEKHEKLVLVNPDAYDSWNALKREYLNSNDLSAANKQIQLTQRAIMVNPKSYYAWFHRSLFFNKIKADKEKEAVLCTALLSIDIRNFHCFNHCLRIGLKVPIDFNNYSTLSHSFNNYLQLIYTDPTNESSWRYFYKARESIRLNPFYLKQSDDFAELIFKEIFTGSLKLNDKEYSTDLPVRILKIKNVENIKSIEIDKIIYSLKPEKEPSFIDEILNLEPNNIFALKTKFEYSQDQKEILKLQEIDPLRKKYYQSLRPTKIFLAERLFN